MFHMPESRFTAFGVHLLISASLFMALGLFCYFILLPEFLFYSEGASTILTLIGGVDVVLGPLITLIIYKKSKPEIKMDLTIIAVIQIAALLYGLYSLMSVRPIAVFYGQGGYHVVYHSTFEGDFYSDISSIRELNQLKPPTIAIAMPEGEGSLEKVEFSSLINTGKSYFSDSSRYRSYQDEIPGLASQGFTVKQAMENYLISGNSSLMEYKDSPYRIYPVKSTLKSGYAVINPANGKFIDYEY